MHLHRDLQVCSQCWAFTQQSFALFTNTRRWKTSGCHDGKNILQMMPSPGGRVRGAVSRPRSRFHIKHQWDLGTSVILGVIKKATEEKERPSSLRPLISSSIKCNRMQLGPPRVLSPGPVGLFCRQVMTLSISHPAWTASVWWLHFPARLSFAIFHSRLLWRRASHNQKKDTHKNSLFLQKNNMAKKSYTQAKTWSKWF